MQRVVEVPMLQVPDYKTRNEICVSAFEMLQFIIFGSFEECIDFAAPSSTESNVKLDFAALLVVSQFFVMYLSSIFSKSCKFQFLLFVHDSSPSLHWVTAARLVLGRALASSCAQFSKRLCLVIRAWASSFRSNAIAGSVA
jgi:hypothetical protein